jgi:hypothetical protein
MLAHSIASNVAFRDVNNVRIVIALLSMDDPVCPIHYGTAFDRVPESRYIINLVDVIGVRSNMNSDAVSFTCESGLRSLGGQRATFLSLIVQVF